jgi:hypothetical protein
VDPRAGLDDVEKRKFLTLPRLELRSLGRPARNQSLYRLRYPASRATHVYKIIFSILPLFKKNKSRPLRSPSCLYNPPLSTFECLDQSL